MTSRYSSAEQEKSGKKWKKVCVEIKGIFEGNVKLLLKNMKKKVVRHLTVFVKHKHAHDFNYPPALFYLM